MWGGAKNPGSRRTTSSFTRSQGMTENGTMGKETQQKISPNNSKVRGLNPRGTLWRRGGSFQREPTQGKRWGETQRSVLQLQRDGALLQGLSQVQSEEWGL
jgi:hypothetical protein